MFRHRTGQEHATDFRRLPWSARVRTVRTGMQLYAGQEAGKSEMQAVKVNTRGQVFRYDEPRQLCALEVASVGGRHPHWQIFTSMPADCGLYLSYFCIFWKLTLIFFAKIC
ncbi:hypothetical protein [Sinorhizobium meliloti]|uniref:hypothetical protein n=1 Tax=Rhizobium meliloti TaxID=382 RepID=UPI0012970B8E|nr:hypothetical protein [Sinorhizobium meliloti]MQU99395.1 hypothetical protein [Sinorhizobium meliloti]